MNWKQKIALKYIQTKFLFLSRVSKEKTAHQAFQLFCTPQIRSIRKLGVKDTEPIQFYFENKLIKGFRWNGSKNKKALIIHGFESAAYKFEYYGKMLAAKGYEVLAFDAPAHGKSQGKTINAMVYSSFIQKIMEQYGPIQSFIAHSFGGLAICLALENIALPIHSKIVLIAPATETTTAIDTAFKVLKINDEEVRKLFDQNILNISNNSPSWFSVRRAIKNINANILWIHDEDDKITPINDVLTTMQDKDLNVKYLITKGLGHKKIYHDTEIKKNILEFL